MELDKEVLKRNYKFQLEKGKNLIALDETVVKANKKAILRLCSNRRWEKWTYSHEGIYDEKLSDD